jgi:diaphanous 1
MKLAVASSDRVIPIPPRLPGTAAASGGGPPPMPGQVGGGAGAGGSTSGLPPKPKIVPKIKLKGLFWTKLKPAEALQTVWEAIEEPQVPPAAIESSFADEAALKKASANVEQEVAPKKAVAKFVSLFDGRRTQNVAIACGKLRLDPQAICRLIIDLNEDNLTADITETLIPLVPTAEETALIRSFDGQVKDLDAPGKLFKALVDIPRLDQRLKVHAVMLSWEEDADTFAEELDIVTNAVVEFKFERCIESLTHMLSLILAVGNYMNGNTSRGQAHGVKLDMLVKLVNIKQTSSNKETLMHFIVKQYEQIFPEDEWFFDHWLSIWKAPSVNMKQLEGDLKSLETSVNLAKAELKASVDIAEDDIRLPLKNNLMAFIKVSEERLKVLQTNFAETLKDCQAMRKFYGDKSDGSGEDDANRNFFELMTKFASMIKRSSQDMVDWEEDVSIVYYSCIHHTLIMTFDCICVVCMCRNCARQRQRRRQKFASRRRRTRNRVIVKLPPHTQKAAMTTRRTREI